MDQGISQETVLTLQRNGFTNKASLQMMQVDDIATMRVHPLAQRRFLEAVIKRQQQPQVNQSTAPLAPAQALEQPSPSGQQDPLATLIKLLTAQEIQQGSTPPAAGPGIPPAQTQPGEHALFVSATGTKFLDVPDYIRQSERVQEKVLMGKDGEEQLVIKTASSKPKLEQITPMQWTGANIRILRDLIAKGQIAMTPTAIFEYLGYIEKVADLATKYTWQSTLLYDREYRKWQAQGNIAWGSDNIHLVGVHLDRRQRNPGTQGDQRQAPHNKNSTMANQKQNPVCRLYNMGKCTLDHCKYRHVCSMPSCNASHPVFEHSANQTSSKNLNQHN